MSSFDLNKVRDKGFELKIEDIENTTGTPVLSVIKDDVKVLEALSKTAPAALHAPRKNFSVAYGKLAETLTGERFKDPRFRSKLLNLVR
ncbi:hypothetical protein ACFL3V_06980, partial [Nanoarchaeota archaeon]